MPKTFTHEDVLNDIRKEVAASSTTEVAERIGVSIPYLSDIVLGKRTISDLVARAFGYEREVITEMVFRKSAA